MTSSQNFAQAFPVTEDSGCVTRTGQGTAALREFFLNNYKERDFSLVAWPPCGNALLFVISFFFCEVIKLFVQINAYYLMKFVCFKNPLEI
jgi:hypothetical protein